MSKAGIILDFDANNPENSEENKQEEEDYKEMDTEELQELLDISISEENYEEASKIRDEINSRKKE